MDMSEKMRHTRLMAFLKKNHFITRRESTQLSSLLQGKALKELNILVDNGMLLTKESGNRIKHL